MTPTLLDDPPVKPISRVLSPDEFDQVQSLTGPGVAGSAKGTSGPTRVLSPDEFDHAQSLTGPAVKAMQIPKLPPIAPRDATATGMDQRTKGKKLAPFDVKDPSTYANPVLRQIVNPAMDNPLTTAVSTLAMGVPGLGHIVGGVMAGTMAGDIARYGYQRYLESHATPDARKEMEADPERVSGEAAAVQAAMLGLAPLIHVGVKSYQANLPLEVRGVKPATMTPDAPVVGVPHGDVSDMELPLHANRFAADLEQGAANARIPVDTPKPAGFAGNAIDMKGGKASGKTPEGLIAPEAPKLGKVTPVETEDAIAAARSVDAERVLRRQATGIRRRPAGEKAPFFETEQGAQTLGAAAARNGLPEDANPYHPDQPQAAAWSDGHTSATETVPNYPEGFSMGGALTDNRIPGADEVPNPARGVDGLQQSHPVEAPAGATTENAALAEALKPSRLREHSVEQLTQLAIDARESIDRAQAGIDAGGDMIRDAKGSIVRNLKYVATDDLHSELARLSELNASEHAAYASVAEAGYRDSYHDLPATERLGHKGKEDLPDADGAVDPERLLADNKIVAEYGRNHIVRAAREKAIERIQRELDSRGGETSFDFGANAQNGASAEEAPTLPSPHERDMIRAKGTLTQVERELAMRGITGDDLAQRIADAKKQRAGEPPAPASEPVADGSAPAQGLAPVEGTGETKTRGLSAGVERKALVNKLTDTVGDLPEYKTVSMADQADRAAELLSTDPALARKIALGEAPAPHDLLPESVFVAVENAAIKNGDVATIRELATGKLTGEATTMGQRIRALGERDPESPVAAIKKVIDVRMGGANKVPMATEETIAKIRKQIAALDVKPEGWAAFIDSLRC